MFKSVHVCRQIQLQCDLDEVYLAVHQKSLTAANTKTSSMVDTQMFSSTTSYTVN